MINTLGVNKLLVYINGGCMSDAGKFECDISLDGIKILLESEQLQESFKKLIFISGIVCITALGFIAISKSKTDDSNEVDTPIEL